MTLIYKPRHFAPQELIEPKIYALCGADALKMYDPKVLEFADFLVDAFGSMICNTWHSEKMVAKYGHFSERGLRPFNTTTGAISSCHKLGILKLTDYSGIDLWPTKISVAEIHTYLEINQKHWSKYIQRIEKCKPDGSPITWIHGDSRPHTLGTGKIHFFKP